MADLRNDSIECVRQRLLGVTDMPTYEYECTECGAVVEIFQSITEPARKKLKKDDPKPCSCQAGVRRRIGTGAGIIFKGSGFYITDYRSESYKNAAKAEKESSDGKKQGDKSEPAGTDKPSSDKKSDSKSPSQDKASQPQPKAGKAE